MARALDGITPASTIGEVLSTAVSNTDPRLYYLPSTASLEEASSHMISHRISCVIIVDEARKVKGMLVREAPVPAGRVTFMKSCVVMAASASQRLCVLHGAVLHVLQTDRDVLRCMYNLGTGVLDQPVGVGMTPASKVVFSTPHMSTCVPRSLAPAAVPDVCRSPLPAPP